MRSSLSKVPLFMTLPKEWRQRLRVAATRHWFQKGDVIFKEGQAAEAIWLVTQGWVFLARQTPEGRPVTILTMTPNDVLCGISAFDRGTYSTSAIAATSAELIRIPAALVSRVIDNSPAFARYLLTACCVRIRHMAEMIRLSQSPVETRFASMLLRLQATFGETIPMTRGELARMVGTRWETSIRCLCAMKRQGWIRSSRGKVSVVRPEKLQALLNGQARGGHPEHAP